jgi:tRNA U54 and U55 pseudouridine synthase Pus10
MYYVFLLLLLIVKHQTTEKVLEANHLKTTLTLRNSQGGRAMTQVVSHWSLTAEARFRSRVSPCGICGGQSGTGRVFSP